MSVKRSATKKSNARSGRPAAMLVNKSATKKSNATAQRCVNKKSDARKSNATKKSNAKKSNATAQKRSATKKPNAAAQPCVNRSGRPVNQARHDGGLKARATQEKTQMMKHEDTNRRFEFAAQGADAVALAMERAFNASTEVNTARDTAATALQGKDATCRYEVMRAKVQRMQLELGEAMLDVSKASAISDQAQAVVLSREAVYDEALKCKEALTKKFNAQHAVAMEQASNAGTAVTAAKDTAAMALQGKVDATSHYEVMRAEVQRMQLELGEAMVDVAKETAMSDQALAFLMSKAAAYDEALKYKEAMTKKFNEQLQALPSAVPAMFCEQLKERAQLPHDFLSW